MKFLRPDTRYQTKDIKAKPTKTTDASAHQLTKTCSFDSQFIPMGVTGNPVGNDKSGIARRNHTIATLSSTSANNRDDPAYTLQTKPILPW